MSKALVPSPRQIAVEEQNADQRRAALERLNAEAATADAERARQIMLQGRTIAEALKQMRAPFEESWLAGKASVVAARRLGNMLREFSTEAVAVGGRGGGWRPSPRTVVALELGVSKHICRDLVRLAEAPDPEFQRYIQQRTRIPSVTGALVACRIVKDHNRPGINWRRRRARGAGVVAPPNPSIDEAYSLIVKALGHLSGCVPGAGRPLSQDIGRAMDGLYAAEDLLKPYRAGYDGTGRKAA